jgi:hypothetical protein
MILSSEKFSEDPNDYGDYKNHDKDSNAHSGLKNVSN